MPACTLRLSPAVWRSIEVRFMSSLPMFIFHGVGADAVSGGTTVSRSSTLTLASVRVAPSSSASCLPRSMPRLLRLRRPISPLTRASGTSPAVFIFAPESSSLSTTTLPPSSGLSLTSTTSEPTSATVSRGCDRVEPRCTTLKS